MLSILLLIILLLIGYRLASSRKPNKSFTALTLIVFNLLIIEIGVYGYFLYQVHSGNSVLLIGHQTMLDHLIKRDILKSTQLKKNSHNSFYRIDPELGYTIDPGKTYLAYKSNDQGLRSNRNYTLRPDSNALRMAAFGDSFVFGDGERNENIWPAFLEKSVKNLEVLNFGVSGYGLAQSYLRFLKDGLRFNPDILFFNYIELGWRDTINPKEILLGQVNLRSSTVYRAILELTENGLKQKAINPLDFFDTQFRHKHLYQPLGISQNRYFFQSKLFTGLNVGLLLHQVLLKRKVKNLTPIKNPDAAQINIKLIENILQTAAYNKMTVIFFYASEFNELPAYLQILLAQHSKHVIYINSKKALNKRFLHHGFKKPPLNRTNHYTAKGNLIYAEIIASILQSRTWGALGRRFEFDKKTQSFIKTK